MGRKFPRHWDMTNFRAPAYPSGFAFLDIYESVLANGTGGTIFHQVRIRNPQFKVLMRGDQNGV